MATVGTGKYTYELVEGWGKFPEGWTLGQTAIVTDSQDRVYLFNRSLHPLIVLDREGNYLDSWGGGVLTDAHGMYIDTRKTSCTSRSRTTTWCSKYSAQGNLLMTMGTRDEPTDTGYAGDSSVPVARAAGPFNSPSDVALSPAGDIYISDGYGNARVHKFSGSAITCSPGARRARTSLESFTFPTACGCTRMAVSLWPTGRTTGSRYSPARAYSLPSGPVSPGLATSSLMKTTLCSCPSWTHHEHYEHRRREVGSMVRAHRRRRPCRMGGFPRRHLR